MSEKNYDPKMHSAEHLLNGAMVRKFNKGRSFTQHVERKKSKCDYYFDRNLTEAEINELETEINEIIKKDVKMEELFIPIEKAVSDYDLSKLPDDVEGDIRIIKFEDFDACPCIGPHVNSTSEIEGVKIISTGFENGILRIRFKRSTNN